MDPITYLIDKAFGGSFESLTADELCTLKAWAMTADGTDVDLKAWVLASF
jgi:hypothetical protein